MEELRILTRDQVAETKPLWDRVFPEDVPYFSDYYYNYRAQDNLAYVISEDEDIRSMLHLSTYKMQVQGNKVCDADYIIGVGTDPDYADADLMDRLMERVLRDMYRNERPFTYVRSRGRTDFARYGFHYIYDRVEWQLNDKYVVPQMLDYVSQMNLHTGFWPHQYASLRLSACHSAHMGELANFVNNKLSMSSDVFVQRDEAYFERLKKEMKSESGNLFTFHDNGRLIGYFACRIIDGTPIVEEAIVTPEMLQMDMLNRSLERMPSVLGRIVNLQAMLELIRLKGQYDDDCSVVLEIRDDIIPENNGVFGVDFASGGSRLRHTEEAAQASVSIEDLTAFFFGYKDAVECFRPAEGREEEFFDSINHVAVLHGIHLNEQV